MQFWDKVNPKYSHPHFFVNYGAARARITERHDVTRSGDRINEENFTKKLLVESFLSAATNKIRYPIPLVFFEPKSNERYLNGLAEKVKSYRKVENHISWQKTTIH